MKRIYFLVPDVDLARLIVNELLVARIEERHIHILAKRGTPLEDLPEASFLQKSDFIPAMERGLALGGTIGTLAGLVAVALGPFSLVVAGGGVVLASGLAGAGVGAWLSGMVGLNIGNTRLKRFEEAIEQGELLMMIDVPRDRVEQISKLVATHHPEAHLEGTEPTVPAFP
ncbi:MAG: DUF1269 domain-containing protein [Candidatus Contendobacter sp.]|nr:DUF1269 domain-containing protein [Candidatus Contendobacter sp.]MDS4059754.1 DUF1269 domain-containing protein [Candidatus Contendobacter sp.]